MLKKGVVTKDSICKDYYVYGLVDPRSNKTVYIGKGKGRRLLSHNSMKNKTSNRGKYELIEELNRVGLKLESKIIIDGLDEKTALDLEVILIYRTGRLAFNEGGLVNYSPGGNWNKGDSLFLNKQDLPKVQNLEKANSNIANILSDYPDISNNKKINAIINTDGFIYATQFNNLGKDKSQIKLISPTLIVELLKGRFPIFYRDSIFSLMENIIPERLNNIPFQDYDEVNYSFVRKVNEIINHKKTEKIISHFSLNSKYAEIEFTNGLLNGNFIVYYNTGQKKHESYFEENARNGKCFTYFENGKIESESLFNNGELESVFKYFPSGIIEKERYLINLGPTDIRYKTYYNNGVVYSVTFANHDYLTYYQNGKIHSKGNYKNGSSVSFHENGNLRFKGALIDGNLQGITKEWFDTGELKKTIDYTNGLSNRIEVVYKKNGEISKVINH